MTFRRRASANAPDRRERGGRFLVEPRHRSPGLSIVSGIALAFLTIKGTTILVLGIASAASEELFFRGVLTSLITSSLAFGLLHQMRGRVRWVWAAARATLMGFPFGGLCLATGSLVGPLRSRDHQRREPALHSRH